MNRLFFTTVLAAGLVNTVFGQGLFLSNIGNTGNRVASSNGLIYWWNGPLVDLYNGDLGVEISGGLTSSSLSPLGLGTYTAATDPKGYVGWDAGQFVLGTYGATFNFPGATAGSTVYINMNMWYDGASGMPTRFNSYAAALAGGGSAGTTGVFAHTTSGAGSPPSVPTGFNNMPSVILGMPEPSAFTLMGLGVGAIWLVRRRR